MTNKELIDKLSKMNIQQTQEYFKTLSTEEKLKHSHKTDDGFYYLDFYLIHYVYIPSLNEWVTKAIINTWNANLSIDKDIMHIPNHPNKFLLNIGDNLILVQKIIE